jgi:hypothetical protein
MKIEATNKHTGEVIELPADTFEQVVDAWRIAQEYSKAADRLKDQLKKLVPKYIGDRNVSEEYNGYMFRANVIQRQTYDKAVMREVLDQDVYDVLVKPDKTKVDTYIKENLADLGDIATQLRASMQPDGKPYEVIRLERL